MVSASVATRVSGVAKTYRTEIAMYHPLGVDVCESDCHLSHQNFSLQARVATDIIVDIAIGIELRHSRGGNDSSDYDGPLHYRF